MGRASKASIRGVALSVLEAIASRPLRVATEFGVEVEVEYFAYQIANRTFTRAADFGKVRRFLPPPFTVQFLFDQPPILMRKTTTSIAMTVG